MLQPEDVAEAALAAVRLPARACVTELILLPTDDRHVRDKARSIAALASAQESGPR
jgi:hypothetical protein